MAQWLKPVGKSLGCKFSDSGLMLQISEASQEVKPLGAQNSLRMLLEYTHVGIRTLVHSKDSRALDKTISRIKYKYYCREDSKDLEAKEPCEVKRNTCERRLSTADTPNRGISS